MINLGAEKDPHEIASVAAAEKVDGILISIHNGMALDYGNRLKEELAKRKINIPVFMGGVLNHKFVDKVLPVDVSDDLKALGFHACKRLEDEPFYLLALNDSPRNNTENHRKKESL